MATQRSLFGNTAPLARRSDPPSSRAAAHELTRSGWRDTQKGQVLLALRDYGFCTSRELAESAGLDRYMVARRLPDLEEDGRVEKGPIRECRIGRRPAVTWRVKR